MKSQDIRLDANILRIFVGFDQREAAAYHVFVQSILDTASVPVAFIPLHKKLLSGFDGQRDGSNAFTFSRYLVPRLCNYQGWALFFDGDMVCRHDVRELWDLREENLNKAVCVVKHDYQTRHPVKYLDSRMEAENKDYPRKNWSSVMLWNCAHYANRALDEGYVATSKPQDIHRFSWLRDELIGELPTDWNYLVREYPPGPAHLYHFTLGLPAIKAYCDDPASWNWHRAYMNAMECAGETPIGIASRATIRVGE